MTGHDTPLKLDAVIKLVQIMRLPIFLPILMLMMCSCTTQAWYQGFKVAAESECYKQPPGAIADCLSRLNKKSHDDYEKERSSK